MWVGVVKGLGVVVCWWCWKRRMCCMIYKPWACCSLCVAQNRIRTVETAHAAMRACVQAHADAPTRTHINHTELPAHAHKQGTHSLLLSLHHSHTPPLMQTHKQSWSWGSWRDRDRGTLSATEEQKPWGQIGVESRMKDLPSSDPQQQRRFERLLLWHPV